ncbi:MAG: redoxin domain-containing protein [Alphaproteobacteria bacterium]|nr:redoxin domain-containing protein [Alphaproteobacteria bacterium]
MVAVFLAGAAQAATRVEPAEYVDDFRLTDANGGSHRLYYFGDAPAVVIMTQGNGCPIARTAMGFLAELQKTYVPKGVVFYMLNSNPQDTREAIAAEAAEFGAAMPILVDENQLVGEQLGVMRTAEIFVVSPDDGYKVVYHGPVDDRLSYERQKAQPEHTYLKDALDDVLAGKPVRVASVDAAPGCIVSFPDRDRAETFSEISYSKTVAPILLDKCVTCHQPGGIGPFALTKYDDVKGWAPMMRETVRTQRMPPWHADPHVGKFIGDRSMSSEEIKTLVHWIEAGAPRGEGNDPLAEAELHAEDWPLGPPDLILTLPAYDVPASGIVDYQYPYVANPLKEDKWLRATTIKVGSRETVHHVLSGYMSEEPKDGAASTSRWEFSTGGYAVGAESTVQPANIGTPFPAGGYIGFQMHYTPVGKAVTDATQIGFYFHKEKPELVMRSSVIADVSIVIPPGEGRHKEVAYMTFPNDALLYSAFPHAHYRGYASDLTLRTPDGKETLLLALPHYDFNWQRGYQFVEPVPIPAGSKLIARYVYDNSERNLSNPDPKITVEWGEQTFQEMLYTAVAFRWVGETSDDMKDYGKSLGKTRLMGLLDDNIDDRIETAELKGRIGQGVKLAFPMLDKNGDGYLDAAELAPAGDLLSRRRRQPDG